MPEVVESMQPGYSPGQECMGSADQGRRSSRIGRWYYMDDKHETAGTAALGGPTSTTTAEDKLLVKRPSRSLFSPLEAIIRKSTSFSIACCTLLGGVRRDNFRDAPAMTHGHLFGEGAVCSRG